MDTFTVKRQGGMILANALQNTPEEDTGELLFLKFISYEVYSMSNDVLIKINVKMCIHDECDQDHRK